MAGPACAEALRRDALGAGAGGGRLEALSRSRVPALSGAALRAVLGHCISPSYSFVEFHFYPALYFTPNGAEPGSCPEAPVAFPASADGAAAFAAARAAAAVCQRLVEEQGEVRRLPAEAGGGFIRTLPDVLHFGLCVPAECAATDDAGGVLGQALPLWLNLGHPNVTASGLCCGRLLGKHTWTPEGAVSQAMETQRDRWYRPVDRRRPVPRIHHDCAAAFLVDEDWFADRFGAAMAPKVLRAFGMTRLWNIVTEPLEGELEKTALRDQAECVAEGHRYVGVQVGSPGGEWLLTEHWGLCVPKACGNDAILQALMPWVLEGEPLVAVEDLFSWGAMPIDFVIAGFAKCGTSTLAASLHQHPRIEMATCDGDDAEVCESALWTTEHPHDFLLPLSTVHYLKSRMKPASARGPVLRGVKDPRIVEQDRAIERLAMIGPRARVVVVVRDPIDALESHYNALECWRVQSLADMARAGATDCLALSRGGGGPGRGWGSMSGRIQRLLSALPEGSVFLVHMDLLVEGEARHRTFNKILRFLGLSEKEGFREGTTFEPRNRGSPAARGFDLCAPENVETLELLRRRHAAEYPKLQELLATFGAREVPSSLLERRTRCDRPPSA